MTDEPTVIPNETAITVSKIDDAEYTNYALLCQGPKDGEYMYYVGRTEQPNVWNRFVQHFSVTKGASWTAHYKPLDIIEHSKGDKWAEDAMVLRYMRKYGVDKVRGGSYSTMVLSEAHLAEITRKFDSADNRCFRCHKDGHFASRCGQAGEEKKMPVRPMTPRRPYVAMYCTRCMRTSHNITECTASNTNTNIPLAPCQICLGTNHFQKDCTEKPKEKTK